MGNHSFPCIVVQAMIMAYSAIPAAAQSYQQHINSVKYSQGPSGDTVSTKVFFNSNDTSFNPDYKSNAFSLEELFRKVEAVGNPDHFIQVKASASADGVSTHNNNLSTKRASSLKNYIISHFGEDSSKFSIYPMGIDWDNLLDRATNAEELSQSEKDNIRKIITGMPEWVYDRNGKAIDSRKKRLMELNGGSTWSWMYGHIFWEQRYAQILVVFPSDHIAGLNRNPQGNEPVSAYREVTTMASDTVVTGNSPETGIADNPNANTKTESNTTTETNTVIEKSVTTENNITVETITTITKTIITETTITTSTIVNDSLTVDTVLLQEPPTHNPDLVEIQAPALPGGKDTPSFNTGINLAGIGLMIANIGFEYESAGAWSIGVPVYYSGWDYPIKDTKFRCLIVRPEMRWYLTANRGFYFGVHTGTGFYNVTLPSDDYRYQDRDGNTPFFDAGLTIGFRHGLGKSGRLMMEYDLGAGYIYTEYDKFDKALDGKYIETVGRGCICPDKLGISLVYRIPMR